MFKKNTLIQFFIFVLGIAIWQLAAKLNYLNEFILPSPTKVARGFLYLINNGALLEGIGESVRRVGVGFLISVVLGTTVGFLVGGSRRFRLFFDPFLQFLRPIPPIAWIPIAILWFGLGNGSAYFLTMIASFFPIFINTTLGVENVSKRHLDVASCFGASKYLKIRHVLIPSALPFILTGYRIGLGFAWMAVVAAEMIAANSGLGYLIRVSQDLLQTDKVLISMIVIGFIGLGMDRGLGYASKLIIKWQ
jgi:ABC-type nitrate/sulfonate/bicarbonate transport system permease component